VGGIQRNDITLVVVFRGDGDDRMVVTPIKKPAPDELGCGLDA
jgi:hypothetical protein